MQILRLSAPDYREAFSELNFDRCSHPYKQQFTKHKNVDIYAIYAHYIT